DIAHFEPGSAARRIGRKAGGEVRGGGLVDIVLDFVGEIAVGGVAADEDAQSARQLAKERHANPRPSAAARWPTPGASIPPFQSRAGAGRRGSACRTSRAASSRCAATRRRSSPRARGAGAP